jgi:hypothetical protein
VPVDGDEPAGRRGSAHELRPPELVAGRVHPNGMMRVLGD